MPPQSCSRSANLGKTPFLSKISKFLSERGSQTTELHWRNGVAMLNYKGALLHRAFFRKRLPLGWLIVAFSNLWLLLIKESFLWSVLVGACPSRVTFEVLWTSAAAIAKGSSDHCSGFLTINDIAYSERVRGAYTCWDCST
eukprot:6476895-Amphidinium_carterae.1